jgi:hypothetical protein
VLISISIFLPEKLISQRINDSISFLAPLHPDSTYLVSFKEWPNEKFALINIKRIEKANEKFVRLNEFEELNNNLNIQLDQYKNLSQEQDRLISVQSERITELNLQMINSMQLLDKAEAIMSKQQKEIKRRGNWIWGCSTTSVILFILTILLVVK